MDANERWEHALRSSVEPKPRKKSVTFGMGGREWRAGARPLPPATRKNYDEAEVIARNYQRSSSLEQMELKGQRQAARAFDGLSVRQVFRLSQASDMVSLVARWRYVCMLKGSVVAEADGWLRPADAAAIVAEVDAELKAAADSANAEALRQREEIERMAREARAKDVYAKVEVRLPPRWQSLCGLHKRMRPAPLVWQRTMEARRSTEVEALPGWFEALTTFEEKLSAIKVCLLARMKEPVLQSSQCSLPP